MLEEAVLEDYMSMHELEEREGIDGRNYVSRRKLFLRLVQTSMMTQPLNHIHFVTLICMMILLLVFHCLTMKIVLYL